MSFSYDHRTGLLITLNGLTVAAPRDMTITALANYARELETLYG